MDFPFCMQVYNRYIHKIGSSTRSNSSNNIFPIIWYRKTSPFSDKKEGLKKATDVRLLKIDCGKIIKIIKILAGNLHI